jgi:hypothetical protein
MEIKWHSTPTLQGCLQDALQRTLADAVGSLPSELLAGPAQLRPDGRDATELLAECRAALGPPGALQVGAQRAATHHPWHSVQSARSKVFDGVTQLHMLLQPCPFSDVPNLRHMVCFDSW